MQKIGHSTNSANAAGEFTAGNPEAGVDSTQIMVPWLNAVQRELVNTIEGLGGTLNPANDSQLLAVIQSLAGTISEWTNLKNRPGALLALTRITNLSSNTALTSAQMGLVQMDASGGARTLTLPASSSDLGVSDIIVRRTDNSGNRLIVQASGSDKIKFHTHLRTEGYPFLVLMGAGDWWHLRSDGSGGWLPVGRFDCTPLGRPVFETTVVFSPGGYGALSSSVFQRAEWPWLWDHAQQSGMLSSEAARVGAEGGWTAGDGVATFRGPEARGEFLRVLSETRPGVDVGRIPGSSQAATRIVSSPSQTGTSLPSSNQLEDVEEPVISLGSMYVTPTTASISSISAYRIRARNISYPGRIKII